MFTPQTCHMSCVICHVSRVTCHVSPVTCHMSHVKKKNYILIYIYIYIFFYLRKKFGQSVGASRWRVCYQRGLPRLVSQNVPQHFKMFAKHAGGASRFYRFFLLSVTSWPDLGRTGCFSGGSYTTVPAAGGGWRKPQMSVLSMEYLFIYTFTRAGP